jgi:outer membrane protein assembly factor BamA
MTASTVIARTFAVALLAAAAAARADAQTVERVSEVRVHGNATTADADVLRLAGVSIGEPLAPDALDAIARRLRDSGRFDTVDVRKRYRSLSDTTDIALVIVVHERPAPLGGSPFMRPLRSIGHRVMFLPILGYADGYGLTYGVRASTVDLLGAGERLSTPFTWGATRRAALEIERTVPRGPFDRVLGTIGVVSRENPRFDLTDRRFELRARGERNISGGVRLGAQLTRATVAFGALDDRLWSFTADASIDTRNDPSFPRTGVFAKADWTALHVAGRSRIDQYRVDARGFQPIVGQVVLAVRGFHAAFDAALPPYERFLAGGDSSLRGYRAGAFDGDRLTLASAELRVPFGSPLGGGRAGCTIFGDTAAAYPYDLPVSRARFRHGVGGGVFFSASVFAFNLNVARNDQGRQRAHVSFGFTF